MGGGWFIALVVVHIIYYTSKFNEFMEEKKGIDGRFVLLKLNKRAFIFLDTTFNI